MNLKTLLDHVWAFYRIRPCYETPVVVRVSFGLYTETLEVKGVGINSRLGTTRPGFWPWSRPIPVPAIQLEVCSKAELREPGAQEILDWCGMRSYAVDGPHKA